MRVKITSFIIFSFLSLSLHAQSGVVSIDSIFFNKDIAKKIIVINKDVGSLNALFPGIKEGIHSENYFLNLTPPLSEFEIGIAYQVTDLQNENYDLYFSQLPIVSILSQNTIVDEPRVCAQFSMCENNGNYTQKLIGVEYSGGWTQSLAKKSLRIEFWKDTIGAETENISLLEMRSDDDWNLQAMYNEPLRIRSKLNFDLWNKIDTLYYSVDEPQAKNGVSQEYVELFVNKEYRGVYALRERLDRKQLKLKKFKNQEIRGELYKGVSWGASTFTSLAPYNNNNELWGGFEYIHPKEEIDWSKLYEFVDFVINEDSLYFYQGYQDKFNTDNAINYFIFLNLLRATDNTGKNTFIARYNKDEPYFLSPWDLDGTFGIKWNGDQDNITNDILTNGFYNRLILDYQQNGFVDKLVKRWNLLRQNTITSENILEAFYDQYNYLYLNGVYLRELIAWPDSSSFLDLYNMDYTSAWLQNRFIYLDEFFNKLELLVNKHMEKTSLVIFPNPTHDNVTIRGSEMGEYLLYNSLGQEVFKGQKQVISHEVDISSLSNGFYLLWINGETHQLIVQ